MTEHTCDLAVIGSGPGGYVAAIRAAQLGMKAIVVEKNSLGGVCLNIGCIPTKALIKSAEFIHDLKRSEEFGVKVENFEADYPKIIERSRKVADQMSRGVEFLLKKNNIDHIQGHGKLTADKKIEVSDKDGNITDTIEAKHTIIATGARPRLLPGIDVDYEKIITSTEALKATDRPDSLIVMGAGAIGIEFAYFFAALGTQVTVVEYMDRILPVEDKDVSKELSRHLRRDKIKMKTNCRVLSAKTVDGKVEVVIEDTKKGKQETLTADKALNAIGIQANIENIGLEDAGVETERGFIKINEKCETGAEGIYAIGDVAGPPWLAHKASAEALACVEIIAGKRENGIDYHNIPGCTYCHPQVASIGMTEDKAVEAGHEVRIGRFPFIALGKAAAIGEAKGFVKFVFDAKTDKILGAHAIGPDVTELIAEAGLGRKLEATAKDIFGTIHAHPTLSEALMEAAAAAHDECVHQL